MPFFTNSRRPLSFSSTFVCVRSVFQIAINNGWCLSLKARSFAEAPLVFAAGCCDVEFVAVAVDDDDGGFCSRFSLWLSRWPSFAVRGDLRLFWELKICISNFNFHYIIWIIVFLLRFTVMNWINNKRKQKIVNLFSISNVILPHFFCFE